MKVHDRYRLRGLNALALAIHDRNVRLGFYENDKVRPIDGQLMNVVGEVAEALEEWRNGRGLTETYWSFKSGPGLNVGPDRWLKVEEGKFWIRDYETEAENGAAGFHREIWKELTPEILRGMPNAIGILKPEGFPSELMDILIRVLDMCGGLGINVEESLADKMAYNETRPYRHGGKRS